MKQECAWVRRGVPFHIPVSTALIGWLVGVVVAAVQGSPLREEVDVDPATSGVGDEVSAIGLEGVVAEVAFDAGVGIGKPSDSAGISFTRRRGRESECDYNALVSERPVEDSNGRFHADLGHVCGYCL